MDGVAGFNIHRGCLAIGERPRRRPGRTCAATCAADPPTSSWRSSASATPTTSAPSFRDAAAFGAGGVLLDPACADPLYRKAIRTSMGAALQVPFATGVPWPDALGGLRRDGWTVVGLTPTAPRRQHGTCSRRRGGERVVLVLGHEGDGLSAATAAACTHLARIPMSTDVDSLNVAMAAGIALYEWRQSR